MAKIMQSAGKDLPPSKRVLELNVKHPVLEKIQKIYATDQQDDRLGDYSRLLYDLAVIGEGGKIENPSRFGKLIGDLMNSALP